MRRAGHIQGVAGCAVLARLRTGWSRLTAEPEDSPDVALLIARAEEHACRARAEVAALINTLDAGGPCWQQMKIAATQAHADEILHDLDRLRSLAETGSCRQVETSHLLRLVMHGLARALDSIAGRGCTAEALRVDLQDTAEFAASTVLLVRHLLAWEQERWRLAASRGRSCKPQNVPAPQRPRQSLAR